MKKLLSILLLVVYTLSASGASVHFHYCMGHLAEVDLVLDRNVQSSCCGNEAEDMEANGCCKNDQVSLAVDDESGISQPVYDTAAKWIAVPVRLSIECRPVRVVTLAHGFTANNGSPPIGIPLYAQFCNFRC